MKIAPLYSTNPHFPTQIFHFGVAAIRASDLDDCFPRNINEVFASFKWSKNPRSAASDRASVGFEPKKDPDAEASGSEKFV
jgi:hypothetical protein